MLTPQIAWIARLISYHGNVEKYKPAIPVDNNDTVMSFLGDTRSASQPPGKYDSIEVVPNTLIREPT